MKMAQGTFEALKAAVLAKHDPDHKAAYLEKGLSPMRYRWDCFHASHYDVMALYREGLNDSHIDTALRAILG